MRKKLLSVLAILLLLPSMVFAKDISLKEFNYSDGSEEYNDAVTETLDGGYIVAATSDWYPVLVKYDKNDKIEWKKYDKTYSYFYDIDIDSKGNIYVAGSTYGDETLEYYNEVAFINKYDANGKLLKTINFYDDTIDYSVFYDLEVDDKKIVAVGALCEEYLQYNPTITADDRDYCGAYSVVLDRDLNVKKEALFDYNSYESFYGATLTKDGGYLAVGYTISDNIPGVEMGYIDSAPIAIKYDKDGKQEWIYDLPYDERLDYSNSCYYNYRGGFNDVVETCDGNYAIVGSYSELTMDEAPEDSSSWEKLDEMLGNSYNGLELDYDSDEYMFYESQAAVLTIVDKTGKEVNKYIENNLYDDVYTDILLTDNCSLMVTGYTGDEYIDSGTPLSLRTNDESLGWNSNTCIRDQSNAVLRLFDKDLKVEWSKDYVGSDNETLINIAPVGEHEFVAVGWMESDDLPEVELSEWSDGLVVRVKITYEITKNPTVNGSFDAANEHGKADVVAKGDTGIITAVPEEGYKVNSVKVVDSKGEEVPVTKVENGKYTYPIHDDTWVTVTFAKVEVAENPKTGINDFLLVGLGVVMVCAGAYYVAQKNNVFRKM